MRIGRGFSVFSFDDEHPFITCAYSASLFYDSILTFYLVHSILGAGEEVHVVELVYTCSRFDAHIYPIDTTAARRRWMHFISVFVFKLTWHDRTLQWAEFVSCWHLNYQQLSFHFNNVSRFASTEIRSCKIEKKKVSRSDVEKWNCPKSDNLTHPKESDISLLLTLFAPFFCQHSTCSHAKYHSCLTNCWNDMAAQSHNEKASALGVEWNFYSYAEKFVVTSSICLHTRHIINIREKYFPSWKRFVIILAWRLIVARISYQV